MKYANGSAADEAALARSDGEKAHARLASPLERLEHHEEDGEINDGWTQTPGAFAETDSSSSRQEQDGC